MKKLLGILGGIMVLCMPLSAQVKITAQIDKHHIQIGDHIKLVVQAVGDERVQLGEVKLAEALKAVPKIEVISQKKPNLLSGSAQQTLLEMEAVLTCFEEGQYEIPAIAIEYQQDGFRKTTLSNALQIQVSTIPTEGGDQDIRDIKSIWLEQRNWEDYVTWALGLLALLAVIYALRRWYKNRNKVVEAPPAPPPPKPAHLVAKEKLQNLEASDLLGRGQVNAYQTELTYILREYLEARYAIPALESTSDEIIQAMKSQDALPEGWTLRLRKMLETADLVKFAKAEPPIQFHAEALAEVRSFVETTAFLPSTNTVEETGTKILLFAPLVFLHPYLLLLLLGIPFLIWYHRKRRKKRYAALSLPSLGAFNGPRSWRSRLLALLPWFRLLAFSLLIVAIARPQLTRKEEKIKAEGIDIMLSMDLSSSMLAQDFDPDRLSKSKELAVEFVKGRPYDRVGLVVFAGESFTQCPLTTDHAILTNFLKELQCGILEDGTAIGMGLAGAVNRLKKSPAKSKIIILLTDGVNNAGYFKPLTAGEIAKELGIRVYCIGVGTTGEALTPVSRRSDGQFHFDMARVEIDEALLKEIAKMTGGQYYRATNAEDLKNIYRKIDKLEKTEIQVSSIKKYSEEFHWWALGALLILVFEFVARHSFLRSLP
jgi:Ca-activated chloride channel family protein